MYGNLYHILNPQTQFSFFSAGLTSLRGLIGWDWGKIVVWIKIYTFVKVVHIRLELGQFL